MPSNEVQLNFVHVQWSHCYYLIHCSRGIPAEPVTGPGHCSYEWPGA